MIDWQKTLISPGATILKAIEIISESSLQIALVVDNHLKLIGIVTDGDIRRAILNKFPLSCKVKEIMMPEFTAVHIGNSDKSILRLMKKKNLSHIPVVDGHGQVIGLHVLREMVHNSRRHDHWVILMAGGLGTRLRPLTEKYPKPLLEVGGKPLLETIITNFRENGFYNFFITLNYKGDLIEEYFGDGSILNVNIKYIREEKKLGTAGSLHLLPDPPPLPMIVMNGDLLTKINVQQVLDFHIKQKASGTMCVRQYDFQVPFGVINVVKDRIAKTEEKPTYNFLINAGIYILEPNDLINIPANERIDMPELFEKLIKINKKVVAFPIHEYWLDIGRLPDFQKAKGEFCEVFE